MGAGRMERRSICRDVHRKVRSLLLRGCELRPRKRQDLFVNKGGEPLLHGLHFPMPAKSFLAPLAGVQQSQHATWLHVNAPALTAFSAFRSFNDRLRDSMPGALPLATPSRAS